MATGLVQFVGVILAIVSAAALSAGNLLQAKGVHSMQHAVATRGGSRIRHLVRNGSWLVGSLVLGIAILLQLGSLMFAPLMVVQPIGVTALVFTVVFTAAVTRRRPSWAVVRAIAICVLGVAAFVTVAALVTTQHTITDTQLIAVLIALAAVLTLVLVVAVLAHRRRLPPIVWVLLGGICSAFVATLGKTVILRVQAILDSRHLMFDVTDLLTLGCMIGIGLAGGLSIYLVQRAHVGNRPEVVVAGLTVVDPGVAVILGIAILGEASTAPTWSFLVFAIAGAVAVGGVFALSRAESVATGAGNAAGAAEAS